MVQHWRVLITGYNIFAGMDWNPSMSIVEKIMGGHIDKNPSKMVPLANRQKSGPGVTQIYTKLGKTVNVAPQSTESSSKSVSLIDELEGKHQDIEYDAHIIPVNVEGLNEFHTYLKDQIKRNSRTTSSSTGSTSSEISESELPYDAIVHLGYSYELDVGKDGGHPGGSEVAIEVEAHNVLTEHDVEKLRSKQFKPQPIPEPEVAVSEYLHPLRTTISNKTLNFLVERFKIKKFKGHDSERNDKMFDKKKATIQSESSSETAMTDAESKIFGDIDGATSMSSINAEVSANAGDYVCNELYYRTLDIITKFGVRSDRSDLSTGRGFKDVKTNMVLGTDKDFEEDVNSYGYPLVNTLSSKDSDEKNLEKMMPLIPVLFLHVPMDQRIEDEANIIQKIIRETLEMHYNVEGIVPTPVETVDESVTEKGINPPESSESLASKKLTHSDHLVIEKEPILHSNEIDIFKPVPVTVSGTAAANVAEPSKKKDISKHHIEGFKKVQTKQQESASTTKKEVTTEVEKQQTASTTDSSETLSVTDIASYFLLLAVVSIIVFMIAIWYNAYLENALEASNQGIIHCQQQLGSRSDNTNKIHNIKFNSFIDSRVLNPKKFEVDVFSGTLVNCPSEEAETGEGKPLLE